MSTTKNTSILVAARVVGLGASLLTLSLLIRLIGVSDYGRFVTFATLITLVSASAELGLSTLASRDLPVTNDPDGLRGELWRARRWTNGLLSATLLCVSGVLWSLSLTAAAVFCLVAAVCTPVNISSSLAVSEAFVRGRAARLALIDIGWKTLWLGSVAGAFVLGVRGEWLWVGFVVTSVLLSSSAALLRRWLVGSAIPKSTESLARVLRRALPLAGFSLVYLAFNRADVLGLSLSANSSVVGRYSTCYRAADAILLLVVSATSVVQPRLADEAVRHEIYQRGRTRLLMSTSWLAALSVASAPVWLRILAGHQIGSLHEATWTVAALGIGVIAYAGMMMDLVTLIGARHHRRGLVFLGVLALLEGALVFAVGRFGVGWAALSVGAVEVAGVVYSSRSCERAGLSASVLGGGWAGLLVSVMVGLLVGTWPTWWAVAAGLGVVCATVLTLRRERDELGWLVSKVFGVFRGAQVREAS